MAGEKKYVVAGLMSGTSLDGLDLVLASFTGGGRRWRWEMLQATTVPYPSYWLEALQEAPALDGQALIRLHLDYGRYLGRQTAAFLKGLPPPLLVASHGHTVYHQPAAGLTFQLGDGNALAAAAGVPVVSDLRSADVVHGGQGAPLVPAGDRYLFGDYDYCLNLGGFSNVSYEKGEQRIAYDISPVNLALQHVVAPLGMSFDRDGALGRSGKIHTPLLTALDELTYYHTPPPKSLGREWMEEVFFPLADTYAIAPEDKLRTLYEHISRQLSNSLRDNGAGRVLVTGGGAHNTFLIERLRENYPGEVIVPGTQLVDYKEALIFAFLGLLRYLGLPNTLASVTGAAKDTCGGTLADPAGKLNKI